MSNKIDELAALVKNDRTYRECSLLCFTETSLTGNVVDANAELPGFHLVRADWDCKQSGKRKGGGLALYMNIRWCNPGHVTVKETFYLQDTIMYYYVLHASGVLSCHCRCCLRSSASPSGHGM